MYVRAPESKVKLFRGLTDSTLPLWICDSGVKTVTEQVNGYDASCYSYTIYDQGEGAPNDSSAEFDVPLDPVRRVVFAGSCVWVPLISLAFRWRKSWVQR